MELLNVRWISRNYFIGAVLRRWYVVLAALAGLWGVLDLWTRKTQPVVIGIALSALVAFLLLILLLFVLNAFSALAKWMKNKEIDPICPHCFDPMSIQFACQCSASGNISSQVHGDWSLAVGVPYITYLTGGLLYNHCHECSGEFFPRSPGESTLRGICHSCGSLIKDWQFYMFHTGKIAVTIEKSLDKSENLKKYMETWNTGTCHDTIKGSEHYVRKQRHHVQHWFRWDASIEPASISQNLTENIDWIWIDKECGSSDWQKTSTILNYIRKELQKINYGFMGNADELRAGSLGIKGSEIAYEISREDFLDQKNR
ncbi:MAG: hypothetical protein JSV88_25670 [Candidatus Aminicenantes bacterium]|nr:MAG: hypothetical protein JSV88_25670 [Candidatus Aminicenantes bacterium]